MATILERGGPTGRAEEKFFFMMACVMSAVIVAGFVFQLSMGRSSFAVPIAYHIHAFVFFGWVVLYMAQNWFVASGNVHLHRKLGWLAMIWTPAMVGVGITMMIVSMRRAGGPFFFDQNQFMFSNVMELVLFGVLVFTAIAKRRQTDWHRRLMFVAMSYLTGPGLGRLLPMPLLMPHAWHMNVAISLIFPLIGMVRDKVRHGRVHTAWYWGVGAIIAVQIVADVIAYSQWGVSFTQSVLAGTPGAERPMAAFLPPGF